MRNQDKKAVSIMKIDKIIFSYPPFISTSWNKVGALHMKDTSLVVTLNGGETVIIPDVKTDLLEQIFNAHAAFLEDQSQRKQKPPTPPDGLALDFPMKFGMMGANGMSAALQHNSAQADMPPLPEEILEKIRSIAKVVAPDDPMAVPKPEPHCNCMYCQIARAINEELGHTDIYLKTEELENEVTPTDLHFQQWDIIQKDEKLYCVVNRLDPGEQYNVFLGHPVGCTCGHSGCEHILAVLKS